DGIRDGHVTGVQTCALPIWRQARRRLASGELASREDRLLVGFTVKQILSIPDLRRRLLLLLALSLSTIVAWWAVSTWIPFYAGQLASRAGGDALRWADRKSTRLNSSHVAI